jgi:hypothetical protein
VLASLKLDAQSRDWLASMSKPIKQAALSNDPCGCDVDTTQSARQLGGRHLEPDARVAHHAAASADAERLDQ